MDSIQYTFQRYEKKFLLSTEQSRHLMTKLRDQAEPDEYGRYSICNIYFDTPQYDMIRHSLKKPPYKEKLRLRSYGIPDENSCVFAEIKKKINGVVYKRRIDAPYKAIRAFVTDGRPLHKDQQIQREIQWHLHLYRPEPKVYIGYDRIAFSGENGDLRITFDWNLRWRSTRLDLCEGDEGELILPENPVVMEVKVPASIPLWLASLLSEAGVYPTSFSKYGVCYMRHIMLRSIERER